MFNIPDLLFNFPGFSVHLPPDWAFKILRITHLLGYHDIRVGNQPDARLRRFIEEQLVPLLPAARERFDRFRDLLQGYVDDELSYPGFAARVIRRDRGEPEDGPELEEGQEDVWPGEQEDEGPDEEPGEGPDESW